MKKFISLLTALVLVSVMMITVASCKKNGGKDSETTEPETLAVPTLTVNEEGLATWTAIENAASYQYQIDEETEMQTLKTSLQLADGQSLKVKAIGDGENYLDSAYSETVTYTAAAPEVVTGIPAPAEGHYMRDADLIQGENGTRYLLYTTNVTAGEDDNAFAVMTGELNEEGEYVYGEQKLVLTGGADEAWDKNLLSATLVYGQFAMGEETYNWLIAYAACDNNNGLAAQIGLAVSKTVDGAYERVGTTPVIAYNAEIYGANMAGCYAPSAINYDKASGIRIFYTYADKYGHFNFFWDANLADLENIEGESAMGVNAGNLHSGDASLMFPNSDMAYDAENNVFFAVKDYSPSAATAPSFATEFEVCYIAEDELYTTDLGLGWVSLGYFDTIDLDLSIEYERAYSACIVSDVYGHALEGDIEIVYNTCMTKATNENYLYTQRLMTYVLTVA